MGNTQSPPPPPPCPAPSIKSFIVQGGTITLYDSETDPTQKLYSKPYLFTCFFDRIEKVGYVDGYTIYYQNKRMGSLMYTDYDNRLFFNGVDYHSSFGMNISQELWNRMKTELDKHVTVSRFGSPRTTKRKNSRGRR